MDPLAGIKNAYRLVKDAVPADHPDRDMVERIDREIARISGTVRQMYTLYSPQAGRLTEVVVGDVIQDVLSMLEPIRREAEVQFDATGVLPELKVRMPDGGLNQVVFNLLTNSEMDGLGSILLVDDEETFREATCRLLLRQGFECRCASNADEAVAGLRERRFDVMIADIRMPGNPDLRVVHAARKLDRQMPVVLVTGYPSAETAIRGIDLSVAAYLTKPLDFDALLGHLRSAIEHSRKRRARAAIRERLQTCLADLDTGCSGQASSACEQGEWVGTIRTLAACLSELLTLAVRSGVDGGCSQNLCELLDCPQQPIHGQALVHAIEVLKKTKDTFKSKALADLRKQLEQLLGRSEGVCCHDRLPVGDRRPWRVVLPAAE